MEVKSKYYIKIFQSDSNSKFILVKLWYFYEKYSIIIRYTTLYIYKENRLANHR